MKYTIIFVHKSLPTIPQLTRKKGEPSKWRIQDFPEGGAPTPNSAIIFQSFSRKLHENERIWTRGASLVPPLDPPMHLLKFKIIPLLFHRIKNSQTSLFYERISKILENCCLPLVESVSLDVLDLNCMIGFISCKTRFFCCQ